MDTLKLIIEIDRRGSNDAVFYQCANIDFEKYIIGKGFKTAQGSFSDILLIAPKLSIAAVNLSSGYYNAHSLHEYIIRSELESTTKKIRYYDDLSTFYADQDNLPQKISSEFQDIYEA